MAKKVLAMAALAIAVGAAFFLVRGGGGESSHARSDLFVRAQGARFTLQGRPFRFVGANVAVMYRERRSRAKMPELCRYQTWRRLEIYTA